MTTITTKELLQSLNALRVANGKTELAAWKQSREKLEAAIANEQPADRTDPSMPMGENGNELVDELPKQTAETVSQEVQPSDPVVPEVGQTEEPAASDLSDVEGQTEATEAPAAIPRGAIGAMSIELLSTTDLPYDEVVARIKAVYPTAKTTARSLASVAMDLRRDGVDVPSRRKPAKAKQAPAEAPKAGE